MPAQFPPTSVNLLSKLKGDGDSGALDQPHWQVSWKRFLELYHAPIEMIARACYRSHTGGQEPSSGIIEDAVANTIVDFFSKGQHSYDRSKGKLRTYLRLLTKARVVDLLRKERPIDHQSTSAEAELQEALDHSLPVESQSELSAFTQSLLATLVEDLRNRIPLRQFEVFERVKLKNQSAEYVAEDLGIQRAMVDRNVYKAMQALRALAQQSDYQEEFHE